MWYPTSSKQTCKLSKGDTYSLYPYTDIIRYHLLPNSTALKFYNQKYEYVAAQN